MDHFTFHRWWIILFFWWILRTSYCFFHHKLHGTKKIGTWWNIWTFLEHNRRLRSLKLTEQFAPENGWLEYDRFLLGPCLYIQVLYIPRESWNFLSNLNMLHPWKLTWHWKITIFNRRYLQMVGFSIVMLVFRGVKKNITKEICPKNLTTSLLRFFHHQGNPPTQMPSLRPWEFLHSLRGAIGWFQAPFRQLNGIFCGSEPPRKLGKKNMKKSWPKSAEGLELVVMYGYVWMFLLLMGWKSWHKWRNFRYLSLAEVNH